MFVITDFFGYTKISIPDGKPDGRRKRDFIEGIFGFTISTVSKVVLRFRQISFSDRQCPSPPQNAPQQNGRN